MKVRSRDSKIIKDRAFFVRLWRATLNLSQVDAASRIEVSSSYFSMIESGKRNPRISTAQAVCKVTFMPLEVMLGIRLGTDKEAKSAFDLLLQSGREVVDV